MSALKANKVPFLNSCNEDNVIDMIKEGVMVCTGNEAVAKKGRDLRFDDDIFIGEFSRPYAQIRGEFKIQLSDVINNRDDTHQKGAKLVEARVGVFIDHTCFERVALPLMGVRRGKFTQEASPQFRFYLYNDGWHLENIVH